MKNSNIKILDCTLRDGGYVNNWNWGSEILDKISDKLIMAGIDILECGYLSPHQRFIKGSSKYGTIENIHEKYKNHEGSAELACMLNYEEMIDVDIPAVNDMVIKILRIAFKKEDAEAAIRYAKKLKNKGYEIYIQPMLTISYSDAELLELISYVNEIMPEAFYIVDSFGNVDKNHLISMFYLIDRNLNKNISIGFHGHNNMQLAYANAIDMVNLVTDRKLILDASVFGMGRGAGNLCTELIAGYLNKYHSKKYRTEELLAIFDETLIPFYINSPWGYSMAYYLCAIKGCHPNYATFLIGKQTLNASQISIILDSIQKKYKPIFNQEYITQLYEFYQIKNGHDKSTYCEKTDWAQTVLLLAPGNSVKKYRKKIESYITKYKPYIIAINFIPDIAVDEIFISNNRRYQLIKNKLDGRKTVFSSNVVKGNEPGLVVSYETLINNSEYVSDDAGLMSIRYLQIRGAKKLILAGFDGYKSNSSNHILGKFDNVVDWELLEKKNLEIEKYLKEFSKKVEIEFLTETIYGNKGVI